MREELKASRRGFLAGAAALAGGVSLPSIVPASALGLNGAVAPSDRITMGFIGLGTMGQGNLKNFRTLPEVQVLAVCDPIRWRRELVQHTVNGAHGKQVCAAYNDFRELVARRDIDAVCIASLDSWHVLHALAAVRSGKDVFVQKPLGMSIEEIQLLRKETQQRKRVFQFGTQQRSSVEFQFATELVRSGRIGKLTSIDVGVHSGADRERPGLAKIEPEPVPEWLDYEMWLGPSPSAPYTTARLTYPYWFHISDYSLGYVSGWGIHHIDIAQWGNGSDTTGPTGIRGTAVWPKNDALCDNPVSWDVHYEYASGVKVHFTGSGQGFEGVRHGITFRGADGTVFVNRGMLETQPASLMKEAAGPYRIPGPVKSVYDNQHEKNFIDCVKSRSRTVCPIDVAVGSDIMCQLAWISFKLEGRKLKWDPQREVFSGDADANRLMKRTLRRPWRYQEVPNG